MKLACVLIPHFPFYVEAERRNDIRNESTIIVRTLGSHQTVTDCSPNLGEHFIGTSLRQILSGARDANVLESDDTTYQHQWNNILDSLGEKSPLVEDSGIGIAYIGLQGIDTLYSGDAQFVTGLERVIPSNFPLHVGVADSKFVAYLAALYSNNRGAFKASSNDSEFVAKFPVDVLPVNSSVISRLHSFGLHTLGNISALSLNVMQAQFPSDGKRIWNLAHGNDTTAFIPRHSEEIITETITFSDPISDMRAIIVGIELLLDKTFINPSLKNRSIRLIDLEMKIYQQSTWIVRCTFKNPVGNPIQAMPRIHTLLQNAKLPGPLEELSISLRFPTKEAFRQMNLLSEIRRREQLVNTLKQLDVVLGEQAPIFYIKEIEPWSRIPERRQVLAPVVR